MVTFWNFERFLGGGTKKIISLLGISFKTQEQIMMTVSYFERFSEGGYPKKVSR